MTFITKMQKSDSNSYRTNYCRLQSPLVNIKFCYNGRFVKGAHFTSYNFRISPFLKANSKLKKSSIDSNCARRVTLIATKLTNRRQYSNFRSNKYSNQGMKEFWQILLNLWKRVNRLILGKFDVMSQFKRLGLLDRCIKFVNEIETQEGRMIQPKLGLLLLQETALLWIHTCLNLFGRVNRAYKAKYKYLQIKNI